MAEHNVSVQNHIHVYIHTYTYESEKPQGRLGGKHIGASEGQNKIQQDIL